MFSKNGDNMSKNGNVPDAPAPPVATATARVAPTAEASVINSGLKVIGNLESDGDIVVAGLVEGDITSRALTVGEGATVKGTISAESINVLGRVEGEIKTRAVRMAASGSVAGNIEYESMAVEEGAEINGQVSKIAPGAERANVSTFKAVERGSAGTSASSPTARAKS